METRPAELGASARSCCRHDGPTTPLRQATGKGHPYPPEVVEAVRALVEGTNLPMRVIAARIGVSRDFVKERRARHGWVRPGPARVSMVGRRGGGPRIVPEVVEAARQLIERTPLSYRGVAAWDRGQSHSAPALVPGAGVAAVARGAGLPGPAAARRTRSADALHQSAGAALRGRRGRGGPAAPHADDAVAGGDRAADRCQRRVGGQATPPMRRSAAARRPARAAAVRGLGPGRGAPPLGGDAAADRVDRGAARTTSGDDRDLGQAGEVAEAARSADGAQAARVFRHAAGRATATVREVMPKNLS